MIDRINVLVRPARNVKACAMLYKEKLGFNLDQLENDEAYLTFGEKGGLVLAIKSLSI